MVEKSEFESKLQCPYCKSIDIIKRGTAKRPSGDNIQVYGCKNCKKRFTIHNNNKTEKIPVSRVQITTSAKAAVEMCQSRILELEKANATLLDNNVKLAAENTRLSGIINNQQSNLQLLEREKTECKQKCEIIIREKDAELLKKEAYIKNLHTTVWHLKNSFLCSLYRFTEIPNGFRFELDFQWKKEP